MVPAPLIALLLCAPAAPASAGTAPGTAAATPVIAPPLRLVLGPDSNVCGVTAPVKPGAKSKSKLGLIVWFHGGMRSGNREKGLEAHRALLSFVDPRAFAMCSPSAYAGADWLTPEAMAHTEALIDHMLARYPIDPADVNLVGVSDGCLAVIRYSMAGKRQVRRRVLISSLPQLALPPENLAAQERFATGSWDFFQGGRDRLFPTDAVVPYLREWERTFPNAHLHFFPDGEHDFSFYAQRAPDLLKGIFASPAKNPR